MSDIMEFTRNPTINNITRYNAGWLLILTGTIIILLMVVYFIILTTAIIKNKFSFYFANDFNMRSRSEHSSAVDGVLTNDRPIYIYENEVAQFKKNIDPTAPPYTDLPKLPDGADFVEEHIYDIPEHLKQSSDSPVSFDSEFDDEFDADEEQHAAPQKNHTKPEKIYENQKTVNENIYLIPKSNQPIH